LTVTAYYNELDPKAAAWLRQLIKNGDITDGEVDERSIIEVDGSDLRGFERVHFFAGIGTWDFCLNNAGWSGPVWTASLPCQPFSVAGSQKGKDDERHLLPHFLELVEQCRPDTIFGEQVESAIRHEWLDDLQTNMEREGYTVGHCVLGAHSVGKAHIRKRLYWVANRRPSNAKSCGDRGGLRQISKSDEKQQAQKESRQNETEQPVNVSANNGVAHASSEGLERATRTGVQRNVNGLTINSESNGRMGDTEHDGRVTSEIGSGHVQSSEERREKGADVSGESERASGQQESKKLSGCPGGREGERDAIDWLYCRDNKYRPIKSGIKPLVDGIARGVVHSSDSIITPNDTAEARTTRIKGYGNAIVAPLAEEFIKAFMDINNE